MCHFFQLPQVCTCSVFSRLGLYELVLREPYRRYPLLDLVYKYKNNLVIPRHISGVILLFIPKIRKTITKREHAVLFFCKSLYYVNYY